MIFYFTPYLILWRECAHTLYTATSEAGNVQVGKINRPQKIPATGVPRPGAESKSGVESWHCPLIRWCKGALYSLPRPVELSATRRYTTSLGSCRPSLALFRGCIC